MLKYIKYFVKYVELNTKVASFFPFMIAMFYYIFYFSDDNGINYVNFVIYFIAMLCFDMATTSINHYVAFHKEKDDISLYDDDTLRQMKELNITMKDNLAITIVLLSIATILGVILVINSNIAVLLLGGLCFLIGISYSYGPKPIAYGPLGEVFSGATMGGILPVIVLFTQYDHIPFELNPLLVVVFIPLTFLIANILLANNICDLEKDENNNRFTLTHYIGKKWAVRGLYLSNLIAVSFIAVSYTLGFLDSQWYLLLCLMIAPLTLNTMMFSKKLSKQESFPFIIKNFIMFSVFYLMAILLLK
ncbi:MAG: UbiA family prenyltransferase [Erysipelotrichales bacterium]